MLFVGVCFCYCVFCELLVFCVFCVNLHLEWIFSMLWAHNLTKFFGVDARSRAPPAHATPTPAGHPTRMNKNSSPLGEGHGPAHAGYTTRRAPTGMNKSPLGVARAPPTQTTPPPTPPPTGIKNKPNPGRDLTPACWGQALKKTEKCKRPRPNHPNQPNHHPMGTMGDERGGDDGNKGERVGTRGDEGKKGERGGARGGTMGSEGERERG